MFTSALGSKTKMPKFLSVLGLFCALWVVECERTRNQIYIDIDAIGACFRRLNGTHQVGCSSSRKGDVGVVHYIDEQADIEWLTNKGPHAPYVALMTEKMFNKETLLALKYSGKVNGALVYYNKTQLPDEGFSSDDTCPNRKSSMYRNDEDYKDCRKTEWNPSGEGLMYMDHGMPIVAVKNLSEFNTIKEKCYEKFNKPSSAGEARQFPLCAALVKDAMDAAKDTPTCIRRSNLVLNLNPNRYCDPLGDHNVFMTTRLLNNSQELPEEGIIVAASKLDGFTLFDTIYPNTDGTLSGFVTLLGAAHALSQYKNFFQDPKYKPIMFTFFQGETFDYIGSSRMAYDMWEGNFPSKIDNNTSGIRPMNVTDISAWLEVSQVGLNNSGKLWVHSDPLSRNDKVNQILDLMKQEGSASGISVDTPPTDQPIPPASLQQFLQKHTIPGVVVADHEEEFENKYYNSRFDVPSTIHHVYEDNATYDEITPAADHLAPIATTIARSLYKMSTDATAPDDLKVEPLMITHLLYCFINNINCTMFREFVYPKDLEKLKKQDINLYVGVSGRGTNAMTTIVQRLMAYWWGMPVPVPPTKNCVTYYKDDLYYNYFNMSGPSPGPHFENSTCIRSVANLSLARSPAFDIPGYDWSSGEYSSWSESIWAADAIKVQIFLLPDPTLEITILCVGVIMFVISIPLTYVGTRRAHMLFR